MLGLCLLSVATAWPAGPGAPVAAPSTAPSSIALSYPLLPLSSAEPLLNPERGWYHFTQLTAANGTLSGQLTAKDLTAQLARGVALIHRYFVLSDYTAHLSVLPQSLLQSMRVDLSLLRTVGMKAVLRFCYTMQLTGPPYHDADPDTVEAHIRQVTPLLQANLDVIAAVEGGWVGVWGETYYTSYYGDRGAVNASSWAARKRVLDGMLAAVAPRHPVAVRYVSQVRTLYTDTPLTARQAFDPVYPASRIALHDDCFVAAWDDEGTFRNDSDRGFLAANSAFTPVGGETCTVNRPDSDCPSTLAQLTAFHWSARPRSTQCLHSFTLLVVVALR